jgi:hypothetical protein
MCLYAEDKASGTNPATMYEDRDRDLTQGRPAGIRSFKAQFEMHHGIDATLGQFR